VSTAAILLLALSLAMDAMAVAAARGASVPQIRWRDAALVAALFGGVHVVMPVVGALVGETVGEAVRRWDHWIAFALLAGIGGKMLWGSRRRAADNEARFELAVLIGMALASGIDALAVGVALPMMGAPMVLAIAMIGAVAALAAAAGLFAGRRFGGVLGKRLEAVGGLVLIGLGARTLIEHLAGGH
jgi:manganese efflux pump family protein